MGKLNIALQKQLSSEELREDAENCLKIYNYLKDVTGHVWGSEWNVLVSTKIGIFPSYERTYKPTSIGYTLLKGLKE